MYKKYIKPETGVINVNAESALMSQSTNREDISINPTPGIPAARERGSWYKWDNELW